LYEQNFSSREFRGIFKLKKIALRRTKKTSPEVLKRVLWKALRRNRHGFIWLLKKETFWHSPTSFE